jgi:hypothetical protein
MPSDKIKDEEYLRRMAERDPLDEGHDIELCGMCYHARLWQQVAAEMVAAGNFENGIARWEAETRKRWQESKFFKLWQEEATAGRDPHKAFEERGWEP